jgi:pimeloyl-ACP methyl ester carboxylesterase
VAPPDMVLPASSSTDAQAAFDAVLAACEADAACTRAHGPVRRHWELLLGSLPRPVIVPHPLTGELERFTLTRDMAMTLVRLPLYVPSLASALPHAITEAAQGRFTALVGLASSLGGGRSSSSAMAMGMHFSVICSEDLPRLESGVADRAGADFGDSFSAMYRSVCADWPRGVVASDFYRIPVSPAPVLVLSGGADPVTPPRHGERVTKALGGLARHVVVPQAGHGVMGLACMRDVIFRYIDAVDDAAAAAVDARCAVDIPRPPAFRPVTAVAAPEAEEARK